MTEGDKKENGKKHPWSLTDFTVKLLKEKESEIRSRKPHSHTAEVSIVLSKIKEIVGVNCSMNKDGCQLEEKSKKRNSKLNHSQTNL